MLLTDNCTLVDSQIRDMIEGERIKFNGDQKLSVKKIDDLVQPGTMDLPLGSECWIMKGSTPPNLGQSIKSLIKNYGRKRLELCPDKETILNTDVTYLIKLGIRLNVKGIGVTSRTNTKSSFGRIDLQTRLITDGNPYYDVIPQDYNGDLWLEVVPHKFHGLTRMGDCLNQIRFRKGDSFMPDDELRTLLLAGHDLVYSFDGRKMRPEEVQFNGGLVLHLDLDSEIIGYRAKHRVPIAIDFRKKGYDWKEFFEAITGPKEHIVIEPEDFYLLSSREACVIPPFTAAEMVQQDPRAGNFASHGAGLFDQHFGYGNSGEINGATATLEVKSHNDAELFNRDKAVCILKYERSSSLPQRGYGTSGRKSNYTEQRGVCLPKFFHKTA